MPDYPHILEQSTTSIIIALSDTEVGKVILPNKLQFVEVHTSEVIDSLPDEKEIFASELKGLRFANPINGLLPMLLRVGQWPMNDESGLPMLIMERLYRMPYGGFDLATRRTMFGDFEAQLKELHEQQFVHGDLMRPTHFYNRNDYEWIFSNIVQTEHGLRLIDAGFSTICDSDNIKIFVHTLFRERSEVECFKEFYLHEDYPPA